MDERAHRPVPACPPTPPPCAAGANITRPIRRLESRSQRRRNVKKAKKRVTVAEKKRWRRGGGKGKMVVEGGIHLEGKGTKGEERLSLWLVAASVSGLAFCDPLSRPIYRENWSIASTFFSYFHGWWKMNGFPRVRDLENSFFKQTYIYRYIESSINIFHACRRVWLFLISR